MAGAAPTDLDPAAPALRAIPRAPGAGEAPPPDAPALIPMPTRERPLTSEPPPRELAPLTSEQPLGADAPLTAEARAAEGW
ncbi:hypothetical protein RM780_05565 [Streptomyces sp. DSM 44917]|uniref:Uncharacterized protein n=1 Tax=Streptomyces boetiae TaxID=3075541 RepID=A0ABU2L4E1_9ACTN|nr:hypothetical protein [Streptomyces sp. DSM 44917]MDT0306429.1 hypothetical protein [Streptomyces sp. DSM 44917]